MVTSVFFLAPQKSMWLSMFIDVFDVFWILDSWKKYRIPDPVLLEWIVGLLPSEISAESLMCASFAKSTNIRSETKLLQKLRYVCVRSSYGNPFRDENSLLDI